MPVFYAVSFYNKYLLVFVRKCFLVCLDKHYGREKKSINIKVTDIFLDNTLIDEIVPMNECESNINSEIANSVSDDTLYKGSRKVTSTLYNNKPLCNEVDPAWGKRYVHAQAKLYILVCGIDSISLRSCPLAQQVRAS
jgi:hypothetical protein